MTPQLRRLPGVPVESNPYSPPKAEVHDVFGPEMDEERLQRLRSGQKLAIVPLINILLLLVVNARATRKLRQAGYKVGFLGVSGRAA